MKKNAAGFTLIELLVVIATTSVLMALLIPGGVSKVREAAAKNQTASNAGIDANCYSCQP